MFSTALVSDLPASFRGHAKCFHWTLHGHHMKLGTLRMSALSLQLGYWHVSRFPMQGRQAKLSTHCVLQHEEYLTWTGCGWMAATDCMGDSCSMASCSSRWASLWTMVSVPPTAAGPEPGVYRQQHIVSDSRACRPSTATPTTDQRDGLGSKVKDGPIAPSH